MINVLEKYYESKFSTKTWYFEQMTDLDLKYSDYIANILQQKESIKKKLKQEYKQRLRIIDEKIESLTNMIQLDQITSNNGENCVKQQVNDTSINTDTNHQPQSAMDGYSAKNDHVTDDRNDNIRMNKYDEFENGNHNDEIDDNIIFNIPNLSTQPKLAVEIVHNIHYNDAKTHQAKNKIQETKHVHAHVKNGKKKDNKLEPQKQ